MLRRYRSLCNLLVFLVLTFEDDQCFEHHWSTPWHIFYNILSAPLPGARIWLYDGLILWMLFTLRGAKEARTGRVKALDTTAWVSIGAIVFWAVYGLANGGDGIQMRLQIHTHVIVMLAGMAFTGVYRTAEDFVSVGRIIVWAALFRSVMALLFVILVMRPTGVHVEAVLDHGDTLLFATTFTICVAHAIHTRTRGTTLRCLFVMAVMLWAIQTNNRRLAWVSLVSGLLVVYFLSTANSARKRLRRAISILVPVLGLYVSIGWGSSSRIFKPLQSFQQMGGEKEDMSTLSRTFENLGLAKTVNSAPLMGTGFGHEYIEISDALAPKDVFPMYRFDPHNSVLGLAAFMGAIGFYLMWLIFPMIAYYAARAYRFATTGPERTVAVVAVAEVIIHVNQMFGDIGIGAPESLVLIPLAMAAASRLAVSTGAMGGAPADQKRVVGAVRVS